ncbi:DUF2182 domain-containing protein [Pseudonocardia bannensis]|uniref:DUF2182 domain-containing protein n=1 Tax=Pseudonocardia bannensis TaxID=630973 RepID=A0A848DFI7_9PSEU|nr:DUF2182 domain-containing protein [Pseudonocardia bannensis]
MLWAVAAGCWLVTVELILLGGDRLGHHGTLPGQPGWPWPARLAMFLAVWLVMVGAMMLPTTVPMARLFVPVSARAPRTGAVRAAFGSGYVAVWTVFAVVALLGDAAVRALVAGSDWLSARPGLVLAVALLVAGAFQFSPLKNACLTACRNPVGFLWQHYRRGVGSAWRLGVRHGLSCLGCCWALMLVMFGTGTGSLAWMLALTAVMVAEKTTRWGARLVAPIGLALIAAGISAALPLLGVVPPGRAGAPVGHDHGADAALVASLVGVAVLVVSVLWTRARRRV